MDKIVRVKIDTSEVAGNRKARPRFKTEAEREKHREAIRRRDEMRSAAKKTAEGGKKI